MKPKETLILSTLFIGAWIGLWLTGPENPSDTYTTIDWGIFWVGIIATVVLAIRSYSKFVQQRDAELVKKAMKRRDARPNR